MTGCQANGRRVARLGLTVRRKEKARAYALRDMEEQLEARGFTSRERSHFDNIRADSSSFSGRVPRFTYISECKNWRVITQSEDQPYWTVQKIVGSSVMWFADFTIEVTAAGVFAFMDAYDSLKEPETELLEKSSE